MVIEMSALDGFRPLNLNEGVPFVSITNNGVTFNKAVAMKLGYPQYVLPLIDETTKRIAIQVCDSNTPNAAAFYKSKATGVLSVRWNGRDLLNTLKDMMNWDLDKEGYKAEASIIREENAAIFDLTKAKPLN